MDRPTLEEQIAWKKKVDSTTDDELANLFKPHSLFDRVDFFIFCHWHFLWKVLNWNWFCIWCGKEHFSFNEERCRNEEVKDG